MQYWKPAEAVLPLHYKIVLVTGLGLVLETLSALREGFLFIGIFGNHNLTPMSFFGSGKNKKPFIAAGERIWVERNFQWLIGVFGYPEKNKLQLSLSHESLPRTFASGEIKLEDLITDLCQLFALPRHKVQFQLHHDIRDSYGIPYEVTQTTPDTDFEVSESGYIIHIANHLVKRPRRLVSSLIYEFIRIRLAESKIEYGASDEDANAFIFLVGINFGFGVILAENLIDIGRSSEGMWGNRWAYGSDIPYEVMIFGIALYCTLADQQHEPWVKNLPQSLKADFRKALDFLTTEPSALVDKKEIEASALYNQAALLYDEGKYEASIVAYDSVPGLTNNMFLKSNAFNGAGYSMLRKGDFEKSIPYFQKALEADPNYGYAHDNLGYALIKTGRLEEGKDSLARAMQTDNNDNAYSYRNLALYYWAKNNKPEADKNFQLAFDHETQPVDLLELHYAEFLFSQGKQEEGLIFLKTAAEKGEHEAISKLKEVTNQLR